MSKKLIALLLALSLLPAVLLPAAAEETEPSEAEMSELRALDEVDEEEEEPVFVAGPTYYEPVLSDFTQSSPAIYTCKIKENFSLFKERDITSAKLVTITGNDRKADVLYVGCAWIVARWKKVIGYIKRDHISDVKPLDPVNTPPYGAQKASYIATTATTCHVRKSMSDEDDCWVVLNPGTMLSIWQFVDGWGVVGYWRSYGYINPNELTDLIPVSPTDTPLRADTPIAAFTSYYDMNTSEINQSRLVNIDVACRRLTRVMQPGEKLDFNADVGPYKESIGYQKAFVLVNGTSQPGYGGGTCQVSSTLYNALLQLPGISIEFRRPHGPSGAKYLPHGVDAAVGNDSLNLVFRNRYDFPIRVEGHTSYDGALLMVVYKAGEGA